MDSIIDRFRPSGYTATPRALIRLVLKATTMHLVFIIFLMAFAIYFNALFNEFVTDDILTVLENPWIRDVRFIPDIFTSGQWGYESDVMVSNYYRPMMHLIYMLNYQVFGLKPWGFHLVNILFHSGVSMLVFIIARRLLEGRDPEFDTQTMEGRVIPAPPGEIGNALTVLPAFAAALLFATHPIHTEAVTWVAGLPDLSYAFFSLLSFYFYVRSRGEMKGSYWLSVASFSLATLCKEPALMLPFILIAYEFAFGAPLSRWNNGGIKRIGNFIKKYVPYFAVSGIYLVLRLNALGGFSPQDVSIKLSPYGYMVNILPLFAQYLGKLLLPINLNAYYVFHPIASLFGAKGLLSLVVVTAFIVFIFVSSIKSRPLFFSLFVIVMPLLPALYIPALGRNAFAERYLYLPSFGFALLTGLVIRWIIVYKGRWSLGLSVVLLAVVVAYSIGTFSRNNAWRNSYTLSLDTVAKSPDSAVPRSTLAGALLERGRTDEAIAQYTVSLRLDPYQPDIYKNLGRAYEIKGMKDKAIEYYRIAVTVYPDADTLNRLGRLRAQ